MDNRVIAVIQYISSNIETKLDLKKIASIACTSPYHFHRLFKQETTITLKKFIESLKIEKAFQMLLQHDSKIQDVASYLGYNDSETFSRAFKRSYKVSPDDLKKIMQKAIGQIDVEIDEERCIVIAFKEESAEQITQKIMQTIKKEQLGENVLGTFKAFSVQQQSRDKNKDKFLIEENTTAAQEFKNQFKKDG